MATATAGKRSTDHVVIDFKGPRDEIMVPPEQQLVMRCLHCDHRYVLVLPVSLSMVAVVTKQYGREHRSCKKRK